MRSQCWGASRQSDIHETIILSHSRRTKCRVGWGGWLAWMKPRCSRAWSTTTTSSTAALLTRRRLRTRGGVRTERTPRTETTTNTCTDAVGIRRDYESHDDDGQTGTSSIIINDACGISTGPRIVCKHRDQDDSLLHRGERQWNARLQGETRHQKGIGDLEIAGRRTLNGQCLKIRRRNPVGTWNRVLKQRGTPSARSKAPEDLPICRDFAYTSSDQQSRSQF
ncbi:hypothetical protein SAMN05216219_1109 [Mycetocola miduiensis]|uniref:Uncharacterized protein n=1 Tax=Mycetocola miduiensis TaxID=995034 RepID=A0A1I4ZVG6_9MICO|nr:hypothetical protein SAMN05216219_1109 [Mycetocola miduiensis]